MLQGNPAQGHVTPDCFTQHAARITPSFEPLRWSKDKDSSTLHCDTLADMTLSYGSSLFSCPWLQVATAAHDWSGQISRCIRRSFAISATGLRRCQPGTPVYGAGCRCVSCSGSDDQRSPPAVFPRPTIMMEIKADWHCNMQP